MSFRTLLATLLLTAAVGAHAEPQSPCVEAAKTQSDLNVCADAELKRAQRELDLVYRKVLASNADDKIFVKRLKKAQQAWLKFRDAELDAVFPHKGKTTYYGTVFPMCFDNWTVKLTRTRIDELKRWLDGAAEGDVCAGSIRPEGGKN